MIRKTLFAAIVTVAACGQTGSDAGVMSEIARSEKADEQAAQQASAGNDAFLAQVRAQPAVEALPSGLLLQFRHRGGNQSLPQPSANAAVLVHYEGKLSSGEVFDSSIARNQPAQFPLAGVVPGFAEAIEHMRPGDEVMATFPPALGYGAEGQPPAIPPNAVLQFRIILLAFQEPGGQVVRAPQAPQQRVR
ncbi:MAG: FKBP-type peptidyl-prolyl cis-trans isomerase [Proteobacteria bacterium]|nr:FKBP-type peptidyl-prolyl cis-trans isomerase [Pseudomonadota bacterium]